MELAFEKLAGLLPAVIQDDSTMEVLMVGLRECRVFGAHPEQRRSPFLQPIAESHLEKGRNQWARPSKVKEMRVDCDADTLLIRVEAIGPGVCHEGYRSCFFRELQPNGESRVVEERTFDAYGHLREKGG